MAKKEIIRKELLKKKNKKWITIYAPKMFNEVPIGESYASDINELIGKNLSLNLMELTNDIKKQNIKIKFRAAKNIDGKVISEPVSYEMIESFVRRVTKRSKSKVDDSFITTSKDNISIRLKPLILTKNKTSNSTLTTIRHKEREFLSDYCKQNNFEDILNELINHSLQSNLRAQLKKYYPVAVAEIRVFKRV